MLRKRTRLASLIAATVVAAAAPAGAALADGPPPHRAPGHHIGLRNARAASRLATKDWVKWMGPDTGHVHVRPCERGGRMKARCKVRAWSTRQSCTFTSRVRYDVADNYTIWFAHVRCRPVTS